MLRVHTDVFMTVYWYSINSVTTMVVTTCGAWARDMRLDHVGGITSRTAEGLCEPAEG